MSAGGSLTPRADAPAGSIYTFLLLHLNRHLLQGTVFPEPEIWVVARDMCRALSYIHGHDILHLDLKPENIFKGGDG